VSTVLQWLGASPAVAILAGGIAVSTSPTIVLQLKNELRAEGQVTERLMAMAALNSIYAAAIVQVATGWLHSEYGNIGAALLHPLYLLVARACWRGWSARLAMPSTPACPPTITTASWCWLGWCCSRWR
jgi:Kef-type K+ transport system membrane component KefB